VSSTQIIEVVPLWRGRRSAPAAADDVDVVPTFVGPSVTAVWHVCCLIGHGTSATGHPLLTDSADPGMLPTDVSLHIELVANAL
jgi:hypothetical protein